MNSRHCLTQSGLPEYLPKDLNLNGGEIQVWCALYSKLDTKLGNMIQLLSDDELSKADKYHLERDRKHFILRHGLLRQLLAHYLKTKADQLAFQRNDYGKPFLKTNSEEHLLFFNLAHSLDLALFVFSRDFEIGIDVEHVHPISDMNRIVYRFFSSPERSEFDLLPTDKRLCAFFRGWTCKEAVLKAIGKGLSNGLDDFSVTLDPDKRARVRDIDSQSIKAHDWSLETAEPIADYVSAVAVKNGSRQYILKYLKLA